ncbi:MAG TPA: hypothetical protein VGX28_03150 [Frankiaceae bacterium]|jgi:hypothetical protein|nr:hypothetical protein [Frankiaceae bacterium]
MRTSLAILAVSAAAYGMPAVPATTLATSTTPAPLAPVAEWTGPTFDPPDGTSRHGFVLLPATAPREEPAHVHDHATHSHAPAAAPPAAPEAAPGATPRRLTYGRWRTPEAAMRFLARAYNAKDAEALKDVTTPAAREMLNPMREWAANLRLVKCTDTTAGSFDCTFTHSIKGSTETGHATLRVNPARKQGWYATLVAECG